MDLIFNFTSVSDHVDRKGKIKYGSVFFSSEEYFYWELIDVPNKLVKHVQYTYLNTCFLVECASRISWHHIINIINEIKNILVQKVLSTNVIISNHVHVCSAGNDLDCHPRGACAYYRKLGKRKQNHPSLHYHLQKTTKTTNCTLWPKPLGLFSIEPICFRKYGKRFAPVRHRYSNPDIWIIWDKKTISKYNLIATCF